MSGTKNKKLYTCVLLYIYHLKCLKFLKIKNYAFNILFPLTQSKSKSQQQEVCTVSSIVLLLTLIGQDMEFVSIII